MNFRRILGILVIVIGIGSVGTSQYIRKEVEAGRMKINRAQGQVDQGKSLFKMAPKEARPVGDILTGSAQSKINEGRDKADAYSKKSDFLLTGGIILIAIGAIFVLIRNKKK